VFTGQICRVDARFRESGQCAVRYQLRYSETQSLNIWESVYCSRPAQSLPQELRLTFSRSWTSTRSR
jgi:hypothetical protein